MICFSFQCAVNYLLTIFSKLLRGSLCFSHLLWVPCNVWHECRVVEANCFQIILTSSVSHRKQEAVSVRKCQGAWLAFLTEYWKRSSGSPGQPVQVSLCKVTDWWFLTLCTVGPSLLSVQLIYSWLLPFLSLSQCFWAGQHGLLEMWSEKGVSLVTHV